MLRIDIVQYCSGYITMPVRSITFPELSFQFQEWGIYQSNLYFYVVHKLSELHSLPYNLPHTELFRRSDFIIKSGPDFEITRGPRKTRENLSSDLQLELLELCKIASVINS